MPRRPKKNPPNHLWQPGQSGNPHGKPKGTKQINEQIREAFALLLSNKLPELEDWLTRAAQKDPIKAADLMIRISERFLPTLSRTEVTGADGQQFTPITINIPVINPRVSLPTPPGEEPKILPATPELLESGEAALTEPLENPADIHETPQFQFLPELPVKPPAGYKREF